MAELKDTADKYVDVAIESTGCVWYNFEDVLEATLLRAIEKALADDTTFSIVNTEGAALVIPWRMVRSVSSSDAEWLTIQGLLGDTEADEKRAWQLNWEREFEPSMEPAPVFQ